MSFVQLESRDLQALGWSLLHFLWQGAACAALLASFNLLLRRAAPQARYLVASATLVLMLGLPLATFQFVRQTVGLSGPATAAAPVADAQPGSVASATVFEEGQRSLVEGLRRRVEPLLPGLVGLWGAGVLLLSLRWLGGWAVVQRLRRSGLTAAPPLVEKTLVRLAGALRVSAALRIYESAMVRVPTVIGWLRPVILLPASTLTGLSAGQLELILAHELAHIRRRDYLVNLLQTAVETLLFYHPAVWWVSHRMRVEREHCCDDLAVAAGGNAVRYARALADLEGLCSDLSPEPPTLVMAATGGSLFARVARLVGPPEHLSRSSRGLAALTATASLGLALAVGSSLLAVPSPPAAVAGMLASTAGADEPTDPPAQESTPSRQTEPKAKPEARSQPRPEARAFPIERILELARAGVTPEYIDEMDALGYATLTAEQLIALRQQGISAAYVRAFGEAGYRNLPLEQLMALRQQGVSAAFAAELKAQGLTGLSLSDLTELRAQGVSADFVAELKKAGYDDLSVSKLMALRSQGVSGRYASELKGLGYDKLSLSKLMALRSQGVTTDYVQQLASLGYRDIDVTLLLGLRSQGVTPDFVRGLKEAGYEGLSPGALIELRSHGVTPAFIREIKEAGFEKLKPEELIALRSQGVRGDLLKRLRGRQ